MKRLLAAMLTLAVLLVAAGCGGGPNYTVPGGGGGTTSGSAPNTVVEQNISFNPATITVKTGATVTWVNQDSVPHQVYFNDGSVKGPVMNPGDTFKHTFAKPGTFKYHCNIHPTIMKGTVVVK